MLTRRCPAALVRPVVWMGLEGVVRGGVSGTPAVPWAAHPPLRDIFPDLRGWEELGRPREERTG